MPQLGLGLGLHKQSILKDPTKELAKLASFLVIGDKADGTSAGKNSPIFTNPWTDLSGDADITLQGFNATSASGWKQETNGGKTFVGLQFDGANDFGIGNNPKLDIVGTGDFAIGAVFKTSIISGTRTILCKTLNGNTTIDIQYQLLVTTNGGLLSRFGGEMQNLFPDGTFASNSQYVILIYRINGILKARLFKTEIYNQLNSINILSKPFFRIGATPTNAEGTTHIAFSTLFIPALMIINGAYDSFTEEELIKKWDAFCKQRYNL